MTETPQLTSLLADLACAFPKQRIDRETFRVYVEDLQDLPPGPLAEAMVELRRTCDWFPTIKQIRERVAELVLGLPGEAAALAQVEGRGGMHPLVKEALALVGGPYAWKTTDEPGVMRGQFGRLYRELRAEKIRGAQLGGAGVLPGGRPELPVSCNV